MEKNDPIWQNDYPLFKTIAEIKKYQEFQKAAPPTYYVYDTVP